MYQKVSFICQTQIDLTSNLFKIYPSYRFSLQSSWHSLPPRWSGVCQGSIVINLINHVRRYILTWRSLRNWLSFMFNIVKWNSGLKQRRKFLVCMSNTLTFRLILCVSYFLSSSLSSTEKIIIISLYLNRNAWLFVD